MKKRLIGALASIPVKKRLIGALASIPVVAALAASDSCALSCPYGNVNDPYPGLCPRYTDLNGDGLCDLSQITAAATAPTSTGGQTTQDPNTVSDAGNQTHYDGGNASATTTDPGSGQGFGDGYHILPISIILIGGYLFTHFLFSKGILNRQKHRRIWNLLVTAGYVGTGVTGILLILMINLGVRIVLSPSVIYLHVELAIVMVIGTLIHIHIHWKSVKKNFKVLFGFKSHEDGDKKEDVNKVKTSGREKPPVSLNKRLQ